MPHKPRNNQRMSQDNPMYQGDAQAGPIRKTILRNPEVPIRPQNLASSSNDIPRQLSATWHDALSNQNRNTLAPPDSRLYHQPRLNKITEMRRTLNDVKNYEAKTLESVHDLTKNSQQLVNREISSKLNFPSHQPIFKNLTKLYDYDSKSLEAARKADKLIQKSAHKVTENPSQRMSHEIREEIHELINELVDLEYSEADKNHKPQHAPLPGEDESLGLTKFVSPKLLTSKKVDHHFEMLEKEIIRELCKSDAYLMDQTWAELEERSQEDRKEKKPANSCKCIEGFYNEHSLCS